MILIKSIKNIFKASLFAGCLNFLTLVLFLKYVNKYEYGNYLILFSLFAFAGRTLQGIDDIILRFQNANLNNNFKKFLITAFFIKISFFILISVLCLVIIYQFPSLTIYTEKNISKILLFSTLLLSFLITIKTFLISSVYSKLLYKSVFKKNTLTSIINFILTLILVAYFEASVIYFIWMSILLEVLQILLYADLVFQFINKFQNRKKIMQKKYFLFFYKNYVKSYALPLVGNNIFSYFNKDHGTNVVLGAVFGPQFVSIISISKLLFEFIHNFISNFIRKLYPVYLHYQKLNKIRANFFKKIFYFGNSFYILICFILLFFKDYYFSFMRMENTKTNILIFIIISFEFIFKFMPSYLGLSIPVSKKTIGLLISNLFRTIVTWIFVFIGVYYNNILVCLLGHIFGIIVSTPILYNVCQPIFKFNQIKILFLIQLFCFIFFIIWLYIFLSNSIL